MADTTIPTTGATPQIDTSAQDLQINLDVNQENETLPQDGNIPKIKEPEFDLNLDLNLDDAPKNDDRLKIEDQKTEDQKNNEVAEQETTTTLPHEETIVETPTIETPIAMEPTPEIKLENMFTQTATPIIETIPGILAQEETPVQIKKNTEAVGEIPSIPETLSETSTTIEDITTTSQVGGSNIPQFSDLKDDMKIIDELEGHESAGGLAPDALPPQQAPIEQAKTFDLDAMLGTTIAAATTQNIQPEKIQEKIAVVETPQMTTSIPAPSIPIPTVSTPPAPITIGQVDMRAITQTTVPHTKSKGVKIFLFIIMFVGLGFTTFFIIKTMYPIEFANMFSSQGPMHASESTTGTTDSTTGTIATDIPVLETTGAQETSGLVEVGTGAHESASLSGDTTFGDVNNIVPTTVETPQNDVSRLTEYATQGNNFLAQGKTINNNTIIKYGLYISKKATTFLEDIANGKEINNLSGYFAQFDQYIVELKKLVGEAVVPVENTPVAEPIVSPVSAVHDIQIPTPDIGATPPNSGITAE